MLGRATIMRRPYVTSDIIMSTELAAQTLAYVAWSCPASRIDYCTDRHQVANAASSEQCNSDCAPSAKAIPRQTVTAPAALVASLARGSAIQMWGVGVLALTSFSVTFCYLTMPFYGWPMGNFIRASVRLKLLFRMWGP